MPGLRCIGGCCGAGSFAVAKSKEESRIARVDASKFKNLLRSLVKRLNLLKQIGAVSFGRMSPIGSTDDGDFTS